MTNPDSGNLIFATVTERDPNGDIPNQMDRRENFTASKFIPILMPMMVCSKAAQAMEVKSLQEEDALVSRLPLRID